MHRLVKRKDFLAAAAGLRANAGSLLLQARDRADETPPRIGLTVTKKQGNAVERNRIRRRLRAAVSDVLPRAGRTGFDYVIVARRTALAAPFTDLINDIERGIARLHSGSRRRPRPATPDMAPPPIPASTERTAHDQ
ncbi:ribonuclease P protein component [Ancylobacter mangrovi]|uniref:ribonuclease P protein component n=1 Tax=Ancylobacter mangrovi TaxID=2972472 RepID=UPI002163E5A8|nr:ribonuclease P protein component [Ancylobacter mangrovi]MCS0502121.1 ribonuclease P protein component [Ancylobacter mangrovi]